MTRTSTTDLVAALRILARDIQSEDGVANAVIDEAARRLEDLQRDIATVLPAISAAAAKCHGRRKFDREFREAADRLKAEALAP